MLKVNRPLCVVSRFKRLLPISPQHILSWSLIVSADFSLQNRSPCVFVEWNKAAVNNQKYTQPHIPGGKGLEKNFPTFIVTMVRMHNRVKIDADGDGRRRVWFLKTFFKHIRFGFRGLFLRSSNEAKRRWNEPLIIFPHFKICSAFSFNLLALIKYLDWTRYSSSKYCLRRQIFYMQNFK